MGQEIIWADRFIKREMLPAGQLAQRFNIHNPRTHPESQREATESSLDTVGWIDEISLSTNGDGVPSLDDNPDAVMFDGHERVEIALARGGPDMLVPCRWYQLTPEETDFALLVKDQTSAMAQIDPEKMGALMERAKAMTGAPGLQGMLDRLKEQVAEGLLAKNGDGAGSDTPPAVDKAAELQEKWQVQPGQLWELGEHRVICGDCTDLAVVERVMGGDLIDLVLTDPPYAVNYGAKNRSLQTIGPANRLETDIEGDTIGTKEAAELIWKPAFKNAYEKSRNGTVIYCFSPQGGDQMMMMMIKAEWNDRLHQLIWRKNTPTFSMGRLDYQYQHEPILYSWRGTNHGFYGDTGRSVIDCDRPSAAKLHPTMKPVQLLEVFVGNSSKNNEIVFDPFLGSGTTLLACDNLNRRCRGIEIASPYVAVTLERYAQHTGQQPELIETMTA